MQRFAKLAAMTVLALTAGTLCAVADDCSGHNHDTGTAVGAGGGALIGGLASHSIAGAVVGGVAGGFAGNAIARSNDCDHRARVNDRQRGSYNDRGNSDRRYHDSRGDYYIDSDGHRHYR